jgi:hypothetical protein
MAEEMRPASKQQAPDPATSYERAKPEKEAGMGRLDNNKSVPTDRPDQSEDAVKNKQDPTHQINAQDQPDHSMHEEEPTGEDQAPTDIHNPRMKRHPRTEGRGGTR